MKSYKLQIYHQIHLWSEIAAQKNKPQRREAKKFKISFKRQTQKIAASDMMLFFRQLATLIAADISLVKSCDILQLSQKKMSLRLLIQAMQSHLNSGKSLTSLLHQYPHYFDSLTCQLIYIGEQSGKLDTMLNRIALHKEKALHLKNKIKQALIYPTIVMIVAFTLVTTMLIFVIPRFADLFQQFHGDLPRFTQLVIQLSDLLRHHALLFLVPIIGIVLLGRYAKKIPKHHKIDKLILKLPFLGNFIQKTFFAQFARSLSTLSSAGIPLLNALKMMSDFSNNSIFTTAVATLKNEIATGHDLYHAMQVSRVFPHLMIQMVRVGEESGSTEQMLEKIASFYETETDEWINNFSHLLEPLIIIILGVLIGGIVIAMYLPIFKLGAII
ncbi:MAG: type II secretion system F family protein [Gammaproteobacteria bacterium]|nr:type II secretion system F family protein [Gammaproteobacteria bacterium]